MVAITEKINDTCQTARIIQWLGGERAVDVPAEFDVTHQIISSKVECIELLRLQPLNKQVTTTFERASFFRRLNRLSPDGQTSDEAYCTLSSHRSNKTTDDLKRKGSTSGSSSLSTATPILSISIDDIYTTLDRAQVSSRMEDNSMNLLREITEQSLHLLPMVTNSNDRSLELLREIIINNGERDFKEMVEEFAQLIETKLSDAEIKMFDTSITRTNSPSLFDMLNDLKTCLTLLRRTEIQSLINVFDNVLKLHFYPSALPENEETIMNNQENVNIKSETNEEILKLSQYAIDELKIVRIEKTHQPLGLTISRSDSGTINIARIVVGGIAATTQLFQVNDRVLEINDESITGRSLDYVCTLMSNTTGLIKFLLAPPINLNPISYQTFHVRALYAYDPFNDPLIPCKELGLAFQRGDILRIVARDENLIKTNDLYVSWWQAYRENSFETDTDLCLAGLIPSDNLQQKRTDLLKAISDDTESMISSSSTLFNRKNRTKKINQTCFTCVNSKQDRQPLQSIYNNVSFIRDMDDKETATIRTSTNHFSLTDTRQFGEEQASTTLKRFTDTIRDGTIDSFRFYESVFRLDSPMTRPIVLLGAPNVGRHELRRRLLQSEPNLFDVAIPHTTRARRLQEIPDVDYHFVSEADFLAKVACHSFVEFGQYDRDLYGTSIDDIRHVVDTKQKICILNLNPDAIRTFNKTDLYPFIICIAAPSFERLKRLELDRGEYLMEKDYREIIRQSRSIERRHCLLFDHVLINNDLNRTYTELHELIVRIQHDDQQWIRACYRRS